MARVAGRSLVMSWIAGIICVGVIVTLIWFALPLAPVLTEYFGGLLRSLTP